MSARVFALKGQTRPSDVPVPSVLLARSSRYPGN